MDDANVPSLLSLPYLGAVNPKDPIYLNTRRFVLYTLRHFPLYHAVARVDDCLGGLQDWLQLENCTTNAR